jgi:hypothetical protein
MRPWSQYLVHLLTAGFIGNWCWSVYWGFRAGYFAFQFESTVAALRSLAPGFTLVVLSAACSCVVRAHFMRADRAESPASR